MRKLFILLLFIGIYSSASAQLTDKDVVPKQYSLEIGPRYIASSTFDNQASFGYTALFDYAWQLSGFSKKNASFISVPLGYTVMMPDSDNDQRMSILSYGWTVRHDTRRDKKIVPFYGYSLLLNQLRIAETDGTTFGHQTKFDFGLNFNTNKRIKYFTKLEYSYTRYPSLGNKKSDKMHTAEIKFGIRL